MRPRHPGTLEGMLTQTAENPVVTEETAAAPVVLTEVTKRYGRRRGTVAALAQVSLSFGAGSFTAVLGVSGSGKSTLLQCRAATGSLTSYIPFGPAAGLVAAVVVLTAGAVMIPFWAMRRREPSLAAP